MAIGARFAVTAVIFCSLSAVQCGGKTPDNRGGGTGSTGNGGNGSGNGPGNGSGGGGIIVPPSSISPDCGNAVLNDGEDCDDSNKNSGDGCNQACRIEADCECPTAGAACVCTAICGDGKLASAEACDDGNTTAGDGCSADCTTAEPNFQCRVAGKRCVPICGDMVVTGTENCDDGNSVSGDGCSSTCLSEPGWDCSTLPCVKSVCGNSIKEVGESCDKGPQNGLFYGDGSGCSKTCTQEPSCRDASGATAACKTPCGDGNVDPGEACDDGNGVAGDGCSTTCTAEDGFMCMGAETKDTQPCSAGGGDCLVLPITYRDFDGQNNTAGGHPDFFYYGATVGGAKVTCVPNASGANLLPLQPNGTCPPSDATAPCSQLVNPRLGADGKPVLNTGRAGGSSCACTFTDWDGTGILTGAAGTMQCNSGAASPTYVRDVQVKVIQSEATFKQWYNDDPLNLKVVDRLELAQVGATNQYQFSSSGGRTVYDDIHDIWLRSRNMAPANGATSLSSGFFPLEMSTKAKLCNLWGYWNAPADCVANDNKSVWQQWDARAWHSGGAAPQPGEALGAPIRPVTGMLRNFYFTSEARYLFRFVGGETLSFFGDDDVWVFINGHLVLDLGAPHERMKGTVTLATTGASAAWAISVQNAQTAVDQPIPGAPGSGTVQGLGLEVGKTYEIAIFHADRHPRESNYQLTLSGFATTRSVCQPRCGDGKATASEECDDGDNNNDTLYGGCTTMCKFGPFCGDMVQNGDEECDLGRMNGARYGESGCTAGCKLPRRCGDGIIDTAFGEACDDGANNGVGACQPTCQFKPL